LATLRRKSREFALQMLFEWDMTRRKPAQVEENFWKQASASDTTQQFADQLFEGAIAHAEASDKVIEKLAENWKLECVLPRIRLPSERSLLVWPHGVVETHWCAAL